MKKFLFVILIILSIPTSVIANGFYLNEPLFIEEAVEGNYYIKGKTKEYLVVSVYDSESKKLGSVVSNKSGQFKVYTNRTLKLGETLKLELEDEYKNKRVETYTITHGDKEKINRPAYVKGYPDKTFRPHGKITRAEIVSMFAFLLNGSTDDLGTSKITKFVDSNDQWFSQALNYISAKGIVNGYSDGTFRPNNFVTRAEFARMIYNYNKSAKDNTFNNENWSKVAIDDAFNRGIIKGYPDGSFKENNELTRAEAVSIFNRLFNRNTNEKSMIDIENYRELITFRDIYPSDWFFYDVVDASNSHSVEFSTQGEVWKTLSN